jgi:predicted esterase
MKLSALVFLVLLAPAALGQKAQVEFLPDHPYDKYELSTGQDSITFYLSVSSKEGKLPLLVFVQGSGMHSLFTRAADGRIHPEYGHMPWFDAAKEECRILIVEKPGVKYLQAGASKAFDREFSLENWSATIIRAIDYARTDAQIDATKVYLAGHSEGGVVAARVARTMQDKVAKVAILAGEGPSQLYSLYKFAEDGTYFNTPEHGMPTPAERTKYLTETWSAILADPNNTEKKFLGFTYLRWSSMLRTSVLEELVSYTGKILLVQGTADKNVHPETATIAYTSLLTKGKNVDLELIEHADHSFSIADPPGTDGWRMVLERTLAWFNE